MTSQSLFNLLVTARLVVFLLGFVIAFQAYRGYRRNDSPPMLYLAVGFALISVRPLVNIPLARFFSPSEFGVASTALDVAFLGVAFLAILYSLSRIE